jgi:hypothetical protein
MLSEEVVENIEKFSTSVKMKIDSKEIREAYCVASLEHLGRE